MCEFSGRQVEVKEEFSVYANGVALEALAQKHQRSLAELGLEIGIVVQDPNIYSHDDDSPPPPENTRQRIEGTYVFLDVLDSKSLHNTLRGLMDRSSNKSEVSPIFIRLAKDLAGQASREQEEPLKANISREFRQWGDQILQLLVKAGVDREVLSAIKRRIKD